MSFSPERYTSVRVKLEDPAYAFWFLNFSNPLPHIPQQVFVFEAGAITLFGLIIYSCQNYISNQALHFKIMTKNIHKFECTHEQSLHLNSTPKTCVCARTLQIRLPCHSNSMHAPLHAHTYSCTSARAYAYIICLYT